MSRNFLILRYGYLFVVSIRQEACACELEELAVAVMAWLNSIYGLKFFSRRPMEAG
jgi:hypothetical protein